jgi:superfamily I DNA/RNA helicase
MHRTSMSIGIDRIDGMNPPSNTLITSNRPTNTPFTSVRAALAASQSSPVPHTSTVSSRISIHTPPPLCDEIHFAADRGLIPVPPVPSDNGKYTISIRGVGSASASPRTSSAVTVAPATVAPSPVRVALWQPVVQQTFSTANRLSIPAAAAVAPSSHTVSATESESDFPSLFDDDDDFDAAAISALDAAQLIHGTTNAIKSVEKLEGEIEQKVDAKTLQEAALAVMQLPEPLLAADPLAESVASHAGPGGVEAPYLFGLNEEQRRAVLAPPGPLLILACAGSGKTKTLERRVMHLLSTGVNARNLLAVTFSKKAAAELRERIKSSIDAGLVISRPAAASDVNVNTFHQLGKRTLESEWEAAGFVRCPHIADTREQKALVVEIMRDWVNQQPRSIEGASTATTTKTFGEEVKVMLKDPIRATTIVGIVDFILDSVAKSNKNDTGQRGRSNQSDRPPFSTPHPHHQTQYSSNSTQPGGRDFLTWDERGIVKYLLQFIHRAKKAAFPPTYFSGAHGWVYQQYISRSHARAMIELDELVPRMAVLLQKDSRVRMILRQRYTHVLVDEWQDVSADQFEVLKLIVGGDHAPPATTSDGTTGLLAPVTTKSAHAVAAASSSVGPNLCITGDDDQSIYSWRGSLVHSFAMFTRSYPTAHSVTLNRTYRHSSTIVNGLKELISHNIARTPKALCTSNPAGEPIQILMCRDAISEARRVVSEIHQRMRLSQVAAAAQAQLSQNVSMEDVAFGTPSGLSSTIQPLRLKDIAVLSRTRRPLELLYKTLTECGIACNAPKLDAKDAKEKEKAKEGNKSQPLPYPVHGQPSGDSVVAASVKLLKHSKPVQDILAYLELILHANDTEGGPNIPPTTESSDSAWDASSASLILKRRKDMDAAFIRVINLPKRGVGKGILDAINNCASQAGISLLRAARLLCGMDAYAHRFETSVGGMSSGIAKMKKDQRDLLKPFLSMLTTLQQFVVKRPIAILLSRLLDLIHYDSIIPRGCGSKESLQLDALFNAARIFDEKHPASGIQARGLDELDSAAAIATAEAAEAAAAAAATATSAPSDTSSEATGTKRRMPEQSSNSVKRVKNENGVPVAASSSSASTSVRSSVPSSSSSVAVPSPVHLSHLRQFLSDVRSGVFTETKKPSLTETIVAPDAVFLNTIHQAKGLEWKIVFVIYFNAGHMPLPGNIAEMEIENEQQSDEPHIIPTLSQQAAKKAREKAGIGVTKTSGQQSVILPSMLVPVDFEEEERRLAYVAMSRAKSTLLLSVVLNDPMGKPLVPSPFLDELPEHLTQSKGKQNNTTVTDVQTTTIGTDKSVTPPPAVPMLKQNGADDFNVSGNISSDKLNGAAAAVVASVLPLVKNEPARHAWSKPVKKEIPRTSPPPTAATMVATVAAAIPSPQSTVASSVVRPRPTVSELAGAPPPLKLSRAARLEAKRVAAAEREAEEKPWLASFRSAIENAHTIGSGHSTPRKEIDVIAVNQPPTQSRTYIPASTPHAIHSHRQSIHANLNNHTSARTTPSSTSAVSSSMSIAVATASSNSGRRFVPSSSSVDPVTSMIVSDSDFPSLDSESDSEVHVNRRNSSESNVAPSARSIKSVSTAIAASSLNICEDEDEVMILDSPPPNSNRRKSTNTITNRATISNATKSSIKHEILTHIR